MKKRIVGGVPELEAELKKKSKLVAMLAPCFVAQFDYPEIITQLKDLSRINEVFSYYSVCDHLRHNHIWL